MGDEFEAPPRRGAAIAVWVAFCASLLVLLYGLLHSDVLRQRLWTHTLADQAELLGAVATICAAVCMLRRGPSVLRGWRGVFGIAGAGIAISFGAGPTLAAVVVLGSCFVGGHALLLAAGADIEDPLSVAVVGISAVILLLVGAGIAHLAMMQVFWSLLIAMLGCVLFLPRLRDRLMQQLVKSRAASPTPAWSATETACAALVLFEVLFLTANAALPERYYDALAMHFLLPTQVLTFGHWTYNPRLAFSFLSNGADYLFAFAMAMGGEFSAKLLNLAILLLAAALLYDIVRQHVGKPVAWITAGLFLGIPLTLIVTASLFVENTLCLLAIGAFRLLLLQLKRPDHAALTGLSVVVSALIAVKLHGALFAAGCIMIAACSQNYKVLRGKDWIAVSSVAAVAGGLGLLTYVYAWFRTGNPVFPFMNDIFRSPLWPPTALADVRWVGNLGPGILYGMTFDSSHYMEAWPGVTGFVFITLLLGGIVATFASPARPVLLALIVAGIYIAGVLTEEQYIRYLYAAFPLLLFVCAHGLGVMIQSRKLRPALMLCIAAVALLDLYKLPSAGWIVPATDLRTLFDPVRRQRMLLEQVPERVANEIINAVTGNAPRVLYASSPYGAFLRGTPIYTNWWNPSVMASLDAARTAEQVKAIIDAQGASFAVVDTSSPVPSDRAVAGYAAQYGRLMAEIGALRVYRVGQVSNNQ